MRKEILIMKANVGDVLSVSLNRGNMKIKECVDKIEISTDISSIPIYVNGEAINTDNQDNIELNPIESEERKDMLSIIQQWSPEENLIEPMKDDKELSEYLKKMYDEETLESIAKIMTNFFSRPNILASDNFHYDYDIINCSPVEIKTVFPSDKVFVSVKDITNFLIDANGLSNGAIKSLFAHRMYTRTKTLSKTDNSIENYLILTDKVLLNSEWYIKDDSIITEYRVIIYEDDEENNGFISFEDMSLFVLSENL
jgi:hypothetical protein